MCLPPVTILGDKADWELILGRLDKLTTFGEEPTPILPNSETRHLALRP
jgi:hypothetical protein